MEELHVFLKVVHEDHVLVMVKNFKEIQKKKIDELKKKEDLLAY